jgi:hypothetical protein
LVEKLVSSSVNYLVELLVYLLAVQKERLLVDWKERMMDSQSVALKASLMAD